MWDKLRINALVLPWTGFCVTDSLVLAAAVVLSLAMVVFSVQENWKKNDHSADNFPKEYAEMMFHHIEPGAIMLVSNDLETGVLGYYHFVENRRLDISLLHRSGFVYNRQFNRPRMPQKEKRKILREFISKIDRPVFFPPVPVGVFARVAK